MIPIYLFLNHKPFLLLLRHLTMIILSTSSNDGSHEMLLLISTEVTSAPVDYKAT